MSEILFTALILKGSRDAVDAAAKHFLHIAHVNSYCRAQISDEISEALEAIELLKEVPICFQSHICQT